MNVLAFDIETVPDLNGINYRDYQYLRFRGKKDKSEEEFVREFSFNPFTLFIVSASGVYIEEDRIIRGFVLFISDSTNKPLVKQEFYAEGRSLEIHYEPITADFVEDKLYQLEEELLQRFWKEIGEARSIVSFNGYSFDGYVLKLRSMIHGIDVPTHILKDERTHIDLMRFLSDGEREKRYKLDFVCRKFGIHTPKDVIDGSKVAEEFYKRNYLTVAMYNLKDSIALAQLYLRLKRYLELKASSYFEEPFTDKQFRKLMAILRKLNVTDEETLKVALSKHLGKRSISELIDLLVRIEKELPSEDIPF